MLQSCLMDFIKGLQDKVNSVESYFKVSTESTINREQSFWEYVNHKLEDYETLLKNSIKQLEQGWWNA